MSATQSKETAAMLKNIQHGGKPTMTQAVLGQVADSFNMAAAKTGWAPLLAMTFVYASQVAQQDQQRKHKNRFLGIEI